MPGIKITKEESARRFFSHIDKTETCWLWTAGVKDEKHPYGLMTFDGKKIKAHRFSWLHYHNEIPEGLHVLHKCDNPRCVNPDHLFLGTQKENMEDRDAKGRLNPLAGEAWNKSHDGTFKPRSGENHPFRKDPGLCARGESAGSSKLTESQVLEIRKQSAEGVGGRQLARDFGTKNSNIIKIVRRETWAHI